MKLMEPLSERHSPVGTSKVDEVKFSANGDGRLLVATVDDITTREGV